MHSFQFTFEAIGTAWVIDITDAPTAVDKNIVRDHILQRIEEFDRVYSRFRHDSLVIKMAKSRGTYTLPDDAKPLLELYKTLYQITNGTVTPLIGNLMEEAGYDRNYSLQTKKLHHPPAWKDAIDYNHPTLTMKKPVLLDFGAAGKGYLIDLIGQLLQQEGINAFCIDAGGDILYKTDHATGLRIGLEHPGNTKQVIGVATLSNGAICGSAGNRRTWGTFHHIINPKTLQSPRDILAVWVISSTTMVADALATCLYFCDPALLQKYYSFEYAIVLADYSLKKSLAFPAEFFNNDTA